MKRFLPVVVGLVVTVVVAYPLGRFECWVYTRSDPGDACIPLFSVPVAIGIGMLAGLMLHWTFVKRDR